MAKQMQFEVLGENLKTGEKESKLVYASTPMEAKRKIIKTNINFLPSSAYPKKYS